MYLTKGYLFAITDIDTQRNLQEFFGRTKITRIQRGANPKAKPDVQEVEIELIDDNVIKMLGVGHHITYMPKDKATLYVGYTRYPQVPKTQEGYIRQGRDTEDGFILFKQGILKEEEKQLGFVKAEPPESLYYAIESKFLNELLEKGLPYTRDKNIILSLSKDKVFTMNKLNKNNTAIVQINSQKMAEDGYSFYVSDNQQLWLVKSLPHHYIDTLI